MNEAASQKSARNTEHSDNRTQLNTHGTSVMMPPAPYYDALSTNIRRIHNYHQQHIIEQEKARINTTISPSSHSITEYKSLIILK